MHGRGAETARLDSLLASAAAGRGGALVVRGEPGVGKTALLGDATRRATGVRLLWTQGLEAESPLAFGALHRLLRPVLGDLDRLSPAHAMALRVAMGVDVGPAADRLVVFVAALSLLAEAAEALPVVAVVDDAHWLDPASAEALLFAARRLGSDRVAMVFGARDGEVRRFDAPGVDEITLGGIDAAAAAAVLADRVGKPVTAEVRDALLEHTGGNPLALVEFPSVLSDDQLTGAARLPERLPLTAGVERTFLDRCRRIPADAQTLLLVAAADDSRQVATVQAAAAELGLDEQTLAAAEQSGLVRVTGAELRFRHPLVRSAVYGAAPMAERERVHAALAVVLAAVGEVDRRAWHLALATEGPDEDVAGELDAVARRSGLRGGHAAASAAWERAAALTPDPERRAGRLQAGAMSAWVGGHPGRARTLAEDARRHTADPILGADIDRLRARLEWSVGSAPTGHRIVMVAARDVAPHDAVRALEMAMLGTALATYGAGSGVAGIDTSRFLRPLPADAPARLRCLEALLAGQQHLVGGRMPAAAVALRQSFELVPEVGEDLDLLVNTALAACHLGDFEVAMRDFSRLLEIGRTAGAVSLILVALSRLPIAQVALGEWDAASTSTEEALTLAVATGQPALTALPLAWKALLAALRGAAGGPDALAELAPLLAGHQLGVGAVVVSDTVEWARGIGAVADNDPAAGLHHLSRISLPAVQRLAALDRVEVAAHTGQLAAVKERAEELEQLGDGIGADWAGAVAAHARALISEGAAAAAHFERALALHRHGSRPFDQARTLLAYGEFLRRAGRRVDARLPLRESFEAFEVLRAATWADRARSELRASGETARRREPSTVLHLTPQEQQIARLVSQGLSNRDVAGRLFVSPRTVEYHLSHAYQKLGVRSRGGLVGLPLG